MGFSTLLHSNAFASAEKVSLSWSGIRTTAGPGSQHRYTSRRLGLCRFPDNVRLTRILLQRNKHNLLHVSPLETVATDNGSEGSTSLSSVGIRDADQGARQSLPHNIQDWYSRARNQDVMVTFKQVLQKLNTELQTTEKVHIFQGIMSRRGTRYVMHVWGTAHAWIKWPIAIFLPWFLFISAFYGTSVSMDLLPLWIIGPLIASIVVKAGMKISASCGQWVADRKLKEGAVNAIEEVRTGRLLLYLVEVANPRYVEAKLQIMKRTSDFILFIRSGAIVVALRQYMYRKLMEQWEIWAERLDDWRLVYLRLERTLKNIV